MARGKNSRNEETEYRETMPAYRTNYKDKIRNHKFSIFYRCLLVLVLVAAIVAALLLHERYRTYTSMEVVSTADRSSLPSGTLLSFAGGALSYSKDGAGCMDAKGNLLWNITYEMQEPLVDICDNVVAIGDYNGRSIYVMDETGLLGTIRTTKPLRSLCVSGNGVVAAVLEDTSVTWIYLYDAEGNELAYFRTTMKDSGYPFRVAISPNGTLVCVAYLYVDSGEVKSSVAFYNFGEVGQNSTDNYVSGYDYRDVVVGYAHFLDDKTLFAVSDDRIMFYTGAQKPVSAAERLLDEEVQAIYYGNGYVGLVFYDTESTDRYRLDVYNSAGSLFLSLPFDMDYTDIVFSGSQIIIYSESDCFVCNMKGEEKYADSFNQTVTLLIPTTSSHRYVLMTPDAVETVELK